MKLRIHVIQAAPSVELFVPKGSPDTPGAKPKRIELFRSSAFVGDSADKSAVSVSKPLALPCGDTLSGTPKEGTNLDAQDRHHPWLLFEESRSAHPNSNTLYWSSCVVAYNSKAVNIKPKESSPTRHWHKEFDCEKTLALLCKSTTGWINTMVITASKDRDLRYPSTRSSGHSRSCQPSGPGHGGMEGDRKSLAAASG